VKLHYFHGRGPLRSLVMLRDQRRVELFIKPIGDDVWALVALSGPLNGQPEKHRCQGPYRSITRAEGVLRSIAGALMGDDYQPQPHDYVVWSVTPALHTPLMSVTNAISSVIVVGALLAVGVQVADVASSGAAWGATVLGFIALVLASVNIFGGFLVTARMLAMYKKKG